MSTKEKVFSELSKVFDKIQETLPSADSPPNVSIKVSEITEKVSSLLKEDSFDFKFIDTAVRLYFKHDDVWVISAGANGGVRLRSSIKKSKKLQETVKAPSAAALEVKQRLDKILEASKQEASEDASESKPEDLAFEL